jgi:hypothetical protein
VKDMDGAIPALIVMGSLAIAHELIRRDPRSGSRSIRSIPMLIAGCGLDPASALAHAVHYMGASGYSLALDAPYAFRVGLDPLEPVALRKIVDTMPAYWPIFKIDLTPREIVLHDGSIYRDDSGEQVRSLYSGEGFGRVLSRLRPGEVVIQVLFEEGVDPSMDNLDHASYRTIWASPPIGAYRASQAYGWLICLAGNPKDTGIIPGRMER